MHLPTIYNALTDANTWNRIPVELRNIQHANPRNWTAPSECQNCCQLDLWSMFAQDTSEISAGRLSKYLNHSCPFADLVQEALRLRCGSPWATVMNISDPDPCPDLLLKSRGWIFTRAPEKKDNSGSGSRRDSSRMEVISGACRAPSLLGWKRGIDTHVLWRHRGPRNAFPRELTSIPSFK